MTQKSQQNGFETRSAKNPLFYVDPHPITLERHGQAGLNDQLGLSFARATNSIPLNAIEFAEAGRTYPIVFTSSGDPAPIALVGLENENYFVDAEGRWKDGCYIPAYVRKYPFALMESPDKQQWILCVDEASASFAPEQPAHPFYVDGQASEVAQRALDFCSAFQQHYRFTQDFCLGLKEQNLLAERVSTLRLPDGGNVNLRGFLAIDEEKFQQLPDEIFLDWNKLGWISLIHAILHSSVNWKYLADMAVQERRR